MVLRRTIALLSGLVVLVSTPAMAQHLRRRAITIGDTKKDSVPLVHVAPGMSTVLVFKGPVRDASFVKGAALFEKMILSQANDRMITVIPKQQVTKPVSLNVVLADGAIVTIGMVSSGSEVDAQVDVNVTLREVTDSPEALRQQNATLRDQLDDCRSSSENAAVKAIASLFISKEAPQAFEMHQIRGGDKQSRLLVQARRIARLFEFCFVEISVENRDPQRTLVLAHPAVRITSSGQDMDLRVIAWESELPELPPDTQERVVIGFKMPQNLGPDHRLTVILLEKDGTRRAELTNLVF